VSVGADPGRGSRILGDLRGSGQGSIWIATASTIVFAAIVVAVIVTSPGWPAVKKAFFNREIFVDSFPEIARAFLLNIRIFLIAEAVILVFALLIAVLRGLPGPVFFSRNARIMDRCFKDQVRHNRISPHANTHDQVMQVTDRSTAQDQPSLAA